MTAFVQHDLKLAHTQAEKSRQDFVTDLRGYLLHDMAAGLKTHYETRVEPDARRRDGHAPENSHAVHNAIKSSTYFKFYSAARICAQEMVWSSVRDTVDRQHGDLQTAVRKLTENTRGAATATLTLDTTVAVPKYVDAVDVHLMPGNYHGHSADAQIGPGALYDNGLSVFSMGLMGQHLSDIGRSAAGYVRHHFPDFTPTAILDVGCTIGHNTLPWAETYPDAAVTGIDVSASALTYAHARACSYGAKVHFQQADASALPFADNSMDVVFSSMFLHELPGATIRQVLAEAKRVLKPGGLMLHMELPPNDQMSPYDGFYLDWDCWYNAEPFYKGYRDLDNKALCIAAGFDADRYLQCVVPSREGYGEEVFVQAAKAGGSGVNSDLVGRLAAGVQWFFFGAWA